VVLTRAVADGTLLVPGRSLGVVLLDRKCMEGINFDEESRALLGVKHDGGENACTCMRVSVVIMQVYRNKMSATYKIHTNVFVVFFGPGLPAHADVYFLTHMGED
jgi:hypothetical protein